MPVHKVPGGYKWGATGKVYKTKAQAQAQARAIYARGWRGDRSLAETKRTKIAKLRRVAQLLRASKRAESRFERDLVHLMKGVQAGLRKMIAPQIAARVPETRMNAMRLDGDDTMSKLFVHIVRGARPAYDRMAKVVDADNAEALQVLGISPRTVPGLQGLVAQGREELVRRVQTAASAYAKDLRQVLEDPENDGLRAEELADLIEKRSDVSLNEARFIARDQTLKTNAAVTRTRQQAAGVSRYTWSTSKDERVRESHKVLEGEEFSYDDPPETNDDGDTNNPGEDWNCRCVAVPVISELEEEEPGEEEVA